MLLYVGLGSFVGGILRYSAGEWIGKCCPTANFPWHTLCINLTGCLVLGVMNAVFARHSFGSQELRVALTVGLCGGFTTFSTFSAESINMLRTGAWGAGLAYIALSFVVGLSLFALGWWLGNRVC